MTKESGVRGCLYLVLFGSTMVLIAIVLSPDTRWPAIQRWAPALRILVAAALAAITTVAAADAAARRRAAGILFFLVIVQSCLRYGHAVGLQAEWERWVVGLVLSSPLIYLVLASGPGRFRGGSTRRPSG